MAVAIRLSRGGAKKRPYYKIVVTDSRTGRDGKFIERIGSYDPMLPKDSPERVKLDADRARHWLSVGAQPSDRVARFLDVAGVKERPARNNPNKGQPGEKAKERAEERATREANLGAHAGGDGGIVIVGTGSIGFARVGEEVYTIGGYGFPVSDEGSGADLGLSAIRRSLWARDGRTP